MPEYLPGAAVGGVHNFHEYGVQLGRRFRALKLWMLIRYFGTEGIAARIRSHCRLARELASWVDADEEWELMAPVPLSTVCLRHLPASGDPSPETIDDRNVRIVDAVNHSGRFYLSHTRLRERVAIRVALGNPRAGREHVVGCWDRLRQAAHETA